jgi:hypothetical protein
MEKPGHCSSEGGYGEPVSESRWSHNTKIDCIAKRRLMQDARKPSRQDFRRLLVDLTEIPR